MAYNQKTLDAYRAALSDPSTPFRSRTCPYCNGERDATVKHLHPSTKPASPWDFWHHVLVKKYESVQSVTARRNLQIDLSSHEGEGKELDQKKAEQQKSPSDQEDAQPSCSGSREKMFVVGPMVDQSELPFRMLCRQYGATLAYTPMLHARSFAESAHYRRHYLSTTPLEELVTRLEHYDVKNKRAQNERGNGLPATDDDGSDAGISHEEELVDRPCIVQFCGNDPDTVLRAAQFAVRGEYPDPTNTSFVTRKTATSQPTENAVAADEKSGPTERYYHCDAVDLNLGCPQGIARRGHYGSFLMEDWDLIHTIVHTLHVELEVPVTVKIRVFDQPSSPSPSEPASCNGIHYDEALSIRYAQMIRDAGAQLLCIHGRTRAMKGQQSGLANLPLIGRIREALRGTIPVLSNGNVLTYDDVLTNLRVTGCEGHMCAEPLLWDPALFSSPRHPVRSGRAFGASKPTRLAALQTAQAYARWLRRCPVDLGFAKAHFFKMLYHSYELHPTFRDEMAALKTTGGGASAAGEAKGMADVREAETMKRGVPPQNKEDDDEEDEVEVVASALDSGAYEQAVGYLEKHLQALYEAEVACDVEGEQPKAAAAAKAAAKAEMVDVFEEEGGLGIGF